MPAMTAPDRAKWQQVLRDCREVDEEEAELLPVDELCAQIRRLPDLHATLVSLISAVRDYANDSSAHTGEVVQLLEDALAACDDVYMGGSSEDF